MQTNWECTCLCKKNQKIRFLTSESLDTGTFVLSKICSDWLTSLAVIRSRHGRYGHTCTLYKWTTWCTCTCAKYVCVSCWCIDIIHCKTVVLGSGHKKDKRFCNHQDWLEAPTSHTIIKSPCKTYYECLFIIYFCIHSYVHCKK